MSSTALIGQLGCSSVLATSAASRKQTAGRPAPVTQLGCRPTLRTGGISRTVVSRRVLQPCQAKRGDVPAAIATEAPGADTLQKAADYFATDKRPIILFDGICNMCNGGVNFMIDWDKTGKHRFAALQSECGRTLLQRCGREPENLTSIVLVTPEKCHIRSDAILSIGRNLDMPMPILSYLAWPVPGFIRDTFYNFIATNRYNIAGKRAMRCGDTSFNDRFIM